MTETKARYNVSIERDDAGMPERLVYSSRIAPPDYIWTYKCGAIEPFLGIGKVLCDDCTWKQIRGEELPTDCQNEATIDVGPKY